MGGPGGTVGPERLDVPGPRVPWKCLMTRLDPDRPDDARPDADPEIVTFRPAARSRTARIVAAVILVTFLLFVAVGVILALRECALSF